MRQSWLVTKREFMNFLGSDRQVFVVYGFMVLIYSFVFATNARDAGGAGPVIWWIFFSIIAAGTFSNMVFVAERLNSAIEILLTSGISRTAVLYGKMQYLMIISALFGVVPFALSYPLEAVLAKNGLPVSMTEAWKGPLLYLAASYLNASCAAWLSFRLGNPRLLHFVSMLVLAAGVGVYFAGDRSVWAPMIFLLVTGTVFLRLAAREIHGERVIQPLHL